MVGAQWCSSLPHTALLPSDPQHPATHLPSSPISHPHTLTTTTLTSCRQGREATRLRERGGARSGCWTHDWSPALAEEGSADTCCGRHETLYIALQRTNNSKLLSYWQPFLAAAQPKTKMCRYSTLKIHGISNTTVEILTCNSKLFSELRCVWSLCRVQSSCGSVSVTSAFPEYTVSNSLFSDPPF